MNARRKPNAYLAKLRPRMASQGSTIDNVVAERRLMEGYCAQFVHCLDYSVSVQGENFKLGSMTKMPTGYMMRGNRMR